MAPRRNQAQSTCGEKRRRLQHMYLKDMLHPCEQNTGCQSTVVWKLVGKFCCTSVNSCAPLLFPHETVQTHDSAG